MLASTDGPAAARRSLTGHHRWSCAPANAGHLSQVSSVAPECNREPGRLLAVGPASLVRVEMHTKELQQDDLSHFQ